MQRIDTTIDGWKDYTLLDSGDGRKLEQFGEMILDRPDPQAIWHKTFPSTWMDAHAQFIWADKGERWSHDSSTPESWVISWHDMALSLSFKGFKHIGVFPEHVKQWEQVSTLGSSHKGLRMLNLFGYTGAASIVAAQSGMRVTHVDASKAAIETLKENIRQSGLPNDAIRTITEDALRYTKRLVQREEQFDVIVMDPPAFGRGPKGEVWKIEEALPELISFIPKLLSPNAKLVILNGYASGFAARTFGELLNDAFKGSGGKISYGDISLQQKNSDRLLTTGIYASWQR